MILSREQILSQRMPTERVQIPWIDEGAGEIFVRGLPQHIVARTQKMTEEDNPDAYVFVQAVVDKDGKRVFTDDDVELVRETMDTKLLQLVVSTAFRLAIVPEDVQERIKKNYEIPADVNSGA